MTEMLDVKVDVSGEMSVPKDVNKSSSYDFAKYLKIQNIPSPLELLQITREYLRPWSEFLNTSNFKAAANIPRLSSRFLRNIKYFQSNYIAVFVALMIYCLVTSPLILLVICGVFYICHRIRKAQVPVQIFGHQLSVQNQLIATNIAAIPVLVLVGAGSLLFWTLGASIFVISLHAAFYNIDAIVTEEAEGFLSEVV